MSFEFFLVANEGESPYILSERSIVDFYGRPVDHSDEVAVTAMLASYIEWLRNEIHTMAQQGGLEVDAATDGDDGTLRSMQPIAYALSVEYDKLRVATGSLPVGRSLEG